MLIATRIELARRGTDGAARVGAQQQRRGEEHLISDKHMQG